MDIEEKQFECSDDCCKSELVDTSNESCEKSEHTCECAHHDHEHHHEHECECGHDHNHEHDEYKCGCEHEHDVDSCGCGHEHEEDECGCGHEHHHEHEVHTCECGCGHDHEHHHHHTQDVHHIAGRPSFTFKVLGLDCPNCAASLADSVMRLSTIEDAQLIYVSANLSCVLSEGASLKDAQKQVIECIRENGYDVELTKKQTEDLSAQRGFWQTNRQKILLSLSGLFLLFGLIFELSYHSETVYSVLYTISALFGLIYLAPASFASLKRKKADMNVLMSIAVIGALFMGWAQDASAFRDAAIVIFLDQIGEWLEGWSMRKTTSSIESLMDLAADIAHVIKDGQTEDINAEDVEMGSLIKILPGEYICLDSKIVKGSSSVNEAAITGESLDKDKNVGDTVYAGTLNGSGVLVCETISTQQNSQLARIVSQVHDSQEHAAPYQSFVDRFASVYTPIVVASAVVVGVVVPLIMGMFVPVDRQAWLDWIYKALSLLVVACPCALVISTPVSFVSAITAAAKHGVLVRGGAAIDAASRIDTAVFDKTGTLTTGNLSVCDIDDIALVGKDKIVSIACSLEYNSTHPIATSISQYAKDRSIDFSAATDITEFAGQGIQAKVEDKIYRVGKLDFARDGIKSENHECVGISSNKAMSQVVVADENEILGVIGLSDTVKPSSLTLVGDLEKLGVSKSLMLTGDNAIAAENIARICGIDNFAAELMPEDKTNLVRDLMEKDNKVVMVGDGINDAPALALATLSVAQGASASDTALEVADVAFLNDDISNLTSFIKLSKHTMRIVKQNIGFAIGIKALIFVLVILGYAGMGAAVFADTGVALLVILNGMRLMLDKSFDK